MTLSTRLDHLERSIAATGASNNVTADAKAVRDQINNLINRFDDADASLSEAERATRFSRAQQLAWAVRFGTANEFAAAYRDTIDMATAAKAKAGLGK